MRSLLRVLGAVALVAAGAAAPAHADDGSPSAFTLKDPRITESSGLAASHAHPGIYWTHNDSGDGPRVFAVDGHTGRTVATVTLRGIGRPRDVEAISIGPDDDVYVGDIGDNLGGAWPHVWIYRFPEPKKLHDVTVDATQYTVQYADGPRNAESLMVNPTTGRVYIADKKEDDRGALYEGPAHLSASGVNVFHRIADIDLWTTDGAFSPDGSRLVLRSYFDAKMYHWVHGRPRDPIPLNPPLEQQGESVTFTPDGRTLMYGSEGEHSEVTPKQLTGDQLPDSVAARDRHGTGQDAAASARGGGIAHRHGATVGALLLAALVAVTLGLRALFRRRSG